MKKFLLAVSTLVLWLGGTVHAGSVVYNQNLANETALAVDQNYSLDLGASNLRNSNIDSFSAQATYAQAAPTAVSFTDGVASTATITVSSMTALHGTAATNTLTLTSNSLAGTQATATVNIASNTFLSGTNTSLYFGGYTFTSNVDYTVGSSSAITATNLAAAIDAKPDFTASATVSTITITCLNVGSANNGKNITSSNSTRLPTSSTFSGGVNNVSFVVNHSTFTQGVEWSVGASSSVTGSNIVTAVNSYSPVSSIILASSATATPGVVTLTVISSGTFGNSYTLTSSSAALLAARSARFSGGINNALLNFNINGSGVVLVEGTDWQAITSSQATALSIKVAIDANATLSALVSVSTAAGGKANLTSKGVGTTTNYGIMTSSPNALGITNGRMFGGAATSVNTASNKITATAHTFTTGLPVLFAKTAGTPPGVLLAQTTYYAIRTDANSFQLAASSTTAVAGTAVSVATQTATGGGAFSLTPLTYSGKANTGFKWQASNDNSNWADLSVSSVTYSSPSTTSSTTFWDFGSVNYRYLRLVVISPTRGGVSLVVPVVGRSNN